MSSSEAKFFPGQLIHHKRFDYRGVVVDVDPDFQGTEEWYQMMAHSKPPREKPWYHVLVDDAEHMTYVAERNLEADDTAEPIKHPALGEFFDGFENGTYVAKSRAN